MRVTMKNSRSEAFEPMSFTTSYTRKAVVAPEAEAVVPGVPYGRAMKRWYAKNQKNIKKGAVMLPVGASALYGFNRMVLDFFEWQSSPAMIPVVAGGESFVGTHGVILLHMLIIGFLTLVVSTFLRFTGRGDLVPLIAFVGGGAILYEVIGMFSDIYKAVSGFLSL